MYLVFKRVVSLSLALILFVMFLPIMAIIAVAIRMESKGSVIFKQLRTGKDGKNFYCYKFRSMVCDNDVHDMSKKDEVTKVGKFIRNTCQRGLPARGRHWGRLAIGSLFFWRKDCVCVCVCVFEKGG